MNKIKLRKSMNRLSLSSNKKELRMKPKRLKPSKRLSLLQMKLPFLRSKLRQLLELPSNKKRLRRKLRFARLFFWTSED